MRKLRRELRELQKWQAQAQPIVKDNKSDIAPCDPRMSDNGREQNRRN